MPAEQAGVTKLADQASLPKLAEQASLPAPAERDSVTTPVEQHSRPKRAEQSSTPTRESATDTTRLIAAMPWLFVLIWASGFIVARLAMPHAPPFKFLSLRFAFSALAFGVWIGMSRAPWPRSRAQWLHLSVTGLLMQAGYLGAVWSAVKAGIGAGTVSLIVGLQPVLTALWLTTMSRGDASSQRVSSRQWLGLLLGLVGLVLVVGRKLGAGEIDRGNLSLAVGGLLFITAGTLYQKRFVTMGDVRTGNAVQLIAAWVVTLPLAWLEHEPVVFHHDLVIALVWAVLGSTVGGSSLFYLLLQRGAATAVASLMYLVPPCTALMAWLVFDETLSPIMLGGMLLTALGVALVVRARPT